MDNNKMGNKAITSRDYNELDVLGFIESCLHPEDGECIIFEKTNLNGITADAYLPNGCKKLSIAKEAYLEILQNMPQEPSRYIDYAKNNKINYVLIITKGLGPFFPRYSKARYKYIRFKSFASWLKQYKALRLGYSVFKRYRDKYNSIMEQQAIGSIADNRVTLFIGAGLGNSLDLPGWEALLSNVYKAIKSDVTEIDIDSICHNDPLIKAGFLFGDDIYNDSIIRNELYPKGYNKKTSPLLEAICDSVYDSVKNHINCIESIITYNYDDYIERKLRKKRLPCKSIYKGIRAGNEFPIYHVHGFIPSPGKKSSPMREIVLTEMKYHEVFNKAYSWINVEQYHALS